MRGKKPKDCPARRFLSSNVGSGLNAFGSSWCCCFFPDRGPQLLRRQLPATSYHTGSSSVHSSLGPIATYLHRIEVLFMLKASASRPVLQQAVPSLSGLMHSFLSSGAAYAASAVQSCELQRAAGRYLVRTPSGEGWLLHILQHRHLNAGAVSKFQACFQAPRGQAIRPACCSGGHL